MKPTRPPEEVLRRVLKTSRLNGWSVAIFAGLCSLVSAALGDLVGAAIGLLVALGGMVEVRGYRLLRRREADGMRWLVRSQLVVLAVIWTYAVTRLMSFDEGLVRELVTPDMRASLNELGVSMEDILPLVRQFFYLLYGSVMAATLIYQGGLALYYRHRTAAVEEALKAPPLVLLEAEANAAWNAAALTHLPEAEQRYYDIVANEMAQKILKPGLWARALAESGAADARAQAHYIRLRVAEMRREESARQS